MVLLSIDPGEDLGWSLFGSGRLLACGLNGPEVNGQAIDRVIIEKPMIYPGSRQKARPADVITLAIRAGEVGGMFKSQDIHVDYVEPHIWKGGSIPKDIMQARIFRRLDDREKAALDLAGRGVAPSKRHNIIDSIGIGLWGLRRLAI